MPPVPCLPAASRSCATVFCMPSRWSAALRRWCDHLVDQGLRDRNLVPRGSLPSTRASVHDHPGFQRGLVRRLSRMPTIPSDGDWIRVIAEVAREGLRNRLIFALRIRRRIASRRIGRPPRLRLRCRPTSHHRQARNQHERKTVFTGKACLFRLEGCAQRYGTVLCTAG